MCGAVTRQTVISQMAPVKAAFHIFTRVREPLLLLGDWWERCKYRLTVLHVSRCFRPLILLVLSFGDVCEREREHHVSGRGIFFVYLLTSNKSEACNFRFLWMFTEKALGKTTVVSRCCVSVYVVLYLCTQYSSKLWTGNQHSSNKNRQVV